jgi:hypothetical protein
MFMPSKWNTAGSFTCNNNYKLCNNILKKMKLETLCTMEHWPRVCMVHAISFTPQLQVLCSRITFCFTSLYSVTESFKCYFPEYGLKTAKQRIITDSARKRADCNDKQDSTGHAAAAAPGFICKVIMPAVTIDWYILLSYLWCDCPL